MLVSGGTGSFGHSFIILMIKKYKPRSLVVFFLDEMKQLEIAKLFKDYKFVIPNSSIVEQGDLNLLINENKNFKKIKDQRVFAIQA